MQINLGYFEIFSLSILWIYASASLFDSAKSRSSSWKDVGSHCAVIWQPSSWIPTCRINCKWNPNQINPLFWAKSGCSARSHLQRHPSYALLSAEQSSPIVIYRSTYSGLASQTESLLAPRETWCALKPPCPLSAPLQPYSSVPPPATAPRLPGKQAQYTLI